MKRIDAHQHFWIYDPAEYPWIQEDWPIRRSFLPEDLKPLLRASGFDGCIAVQARQSLKETEWLLALAAENPFIAGVVGWVNLRSPEVESQLSRFAAHPKFVGVRHVVQDEPDDAFMLGADFLRGISTLPQFNLAYDLLIFPRQLPAAIELVCRFPDLRFVLDHIAKPDIKAGQIEPWAIQVRELAKSPNVYCKISGLVTEAKWRRWHPSDFRAYLDIVWAAFGPGRLMLGSDWPVCLLSADYAQVMGMAFDFLKQFPVEDQEKIIGANAISFYRLPTEYAAPR
jgi:L-fuconolactonase